MKEHRLARAIAAIDACNAGDPHGKELVHAEMATRWVKRLRPDAGEPLLLAARAHHVRRWTIPRGEYPEGRTGYLHWRRALQDVHAACLREVMSAEGYGAAEIDAAERILRKQDLARNPDAQALEDALCLIFLETQFAGLARKLEREKMIDVLRKTMRKMSPAGIGLALELELGQERGLLEAAAVE
jgi:hypothetical protein